MTVSGVTATGAAVSGTIFLKDSTGHELSMATTDGTFSFDVSALKPPFMLKASWGGKAMYSFAAAAGTANITPLTQMIVAAAASSTDLDAAYQAPSPTTFSTIAANLPAATANLRNSLKPLLASYGADMDPISGKFSANGSGMDGLLDHVAVASVSGTVSITDRSSGATLFSATASPALANSVSAMNWANDAAAVAQDPDLKVSEAGDGLAVWWSYTGTGYGASVIQARWLNSEQSATQISTATGFAMMPKVAIDGSGNAVVVWMQSDNQLNSVWVNRYVAGSGWGSPKKLTSAVSSATGPSGVPSVAIDAAGNAVIMWNQSDAAVSSHFDVYASRYSVTGDSWSAPAMLSSGTNCAYGYKVVANNAGAVAVIYNQFQRTDGIGGNGDASDIWVATGTTTGGFTTRTKVSSSPNPIYGQGSLAIDPVGDLLAAWIQNNNSGYFDVWASRQPAGGSWEAPKTVANSVTGECYSPEVAFDAHGNALATWEQQLDTEGRQYVAASHYSAASGMWDAPAEISENIGNTYDQHIAVDPSGNATLVWYQIESAAVTVRSAQYLLSSGWGASQLIATMGAAYDGYMVFPVPRVAVNSSGKSIIIWGTSSM
ncbi:hypothetical protein FO488_10525 [Geobacter sp. FeAm09]|uniref:hypothetical protein n=1 Tax=Geobacter sp. FeAm09 TaxID=2597769 RepID=UPI0011EE0F4C|nr:hypothetical protein [Geobacter sp. FeAm09]QEM68562.1 hypothetical protein FO488_10525 [Geobacter sp. FeAm09]